MPEMPTILLCSSTTEWSTSLSVTSQSAAIERQIATLEKLLKYGPTQKTENPAGELFLVLPRPGTISPWSSKATDIASHCGLEAVERLERGPIVRARNHAADVVAGAFRVAAPSIVRAPIFQAKTAGGRNLHEIKIKALLPFDGGGG